MWRWYAAVLVALLVLGPAAGRAQEYPFEDGEARNLFLAGQAAFNNGSYERALDYFEQAYALSQRPGLLYNIAISADRLRRDPRALEAFREYLALEPETERRAEVQARIAFLETHLRREPEPDPEPEPEPQPSVPDTGEPETQASTGGGVHPLGIFTLVGGGVFLGAFGVFAALSEIEDQRLATRCGRDVGSNCTPSAVQFLERLNVTADVLLIAGGAVAVTGLILLFALPPEQPRQDLAVFPWVTPEGAGTGMGGRWWAFGRAPCCSPW